MRQPLRVRGTVILALLVAGAMAVSPRPLFAQSGREFKAHKEWCEKVAEGTHNNDPNNPTCTPGSRGGSGFGSSFGGAGFSSRQQAALGLAGAFGSMLGNAIRESAEANARQAEIDRMQRAWEMEQERVRLEEERKRQQEERERKHRELMSKLKGSLGRTELGTKPIGGGTLELKSGNALFGRPGNPTGTIEEGAPVVAGIPNLLEPATVEGRPLNPDLVKATEKAWDDYLAAVQRKNKAEAKLKQAEADQQMIEQLRREAEKKLQEQRAHVAAIPPERPEEKKIEDDKLAQAEKLLNEAIKLDEDAMTDLAAAKKDVEDAKTALAESEKKKQQAMKAAKE